MPSRSKTTPRSGRRQEILDAALASFLEKGVLATTIDDIRLAAGASIGSLYHHFESKEDLVAALYVEGLADYQEGAVAALHQHPAAEEGVKAAVVHHVRWVMEHRDLARFIFAIDGMDALGSRSEELKQINRKFFAECRQWLSGHVHSGEIREVPADLYYALWIGPAHELARHLLSGRVKTRWQSAADLLADAAWQALRTPAPT